MPEGIRFTNFLNRRETRIGFGAQPGRKPEGFAHFSQWGANENRLPSDTHNLHRSITVRMRGDLLIHAGDFSFFFEDRPAIRDFNAWLGELPFRHKVVIPGNHERVMYDRPELRKLITNAKLLINEELIIDGIKLWGSPVTCDDEAFGYTTANERRALYKTIPADTDILITHGPPSGVLDVEFSGNGVHRGCPELLAEVRG